MSGIPVTDVWCLLEGVKEMLTETGAGAVWDKMTMHAMQTNVQETKRWRPALLFEDVIVTMGRVD
jgi:hypothetical protein